MFTGAHKPPFFFPNLKKCKRTTKRTTRKITETMKNKEERKYIKEAIRLIQLTKDDKDFSEGRFNAILDVLKHADEVVKKSTIHSVVGQSEQLKCGMNHNEPNCNCDFKHCEEQGW